MSLPAAWIAVAAVLALLLGLWLMLAGRGMRQRRGLGGGKTVSLDRVTLTSRRLGLTGRPDWLLEADGTIIVEEGTAFPEDPPACPRGLCGRHGLAAFPSAHRSGSQPTGRSLGSPPAGPRRM